MHISGRGKRSLADYNDLAVGICFYDDPSIIRLLDSLPQSIQKIVIDGRFKLSKFHNKLSDETLRDKIKSYPKTILADAPDMYEHEKRNQYLKFMRGFKFGLMLDSDEYVSRADWSLFLADCRRFDDGIYGVHFDIDSGSGAHYPRLFVNPSDWSYYQKHNIFRNSKTNDLVHSSQASIQWQKEQLQGLSIGMNDNLRSEQYVNCVYDYQVELLKYEK